MADELPTDQTRSIHDAIYAGNKIEAIKLYRMVVGKDLKDTKDVVENYDHETGSRKPRYACKTAKTGRDIGHAGILESHGGRDYLRITYYYVFTQG